MQKTNHVLCCSQRQRLHCVCLATTCSWIELIKNITRRAHEQSRRLISGNKKWLNLFSGYHIRATIHKSIIGKLQTVNYFSSSQECSYSHKTCAWMHEHAENWQKKTNNILHKPWLQLIVLKDMQYACLTFCGKKVLPNLFVHKQNMLLLFSGILLVWWVPQSRDTPVQRKSQIKNREFSENVLHTIQYDIRKQ
jgi:hypothetical protein